jgi:hypothetical protein
MMCVILVSERASILYDETEIQQPASDGGRVNGQEETVHHKHERLADGTSIDGDTERIDSWVLQRERLRT